jgi:hypothetical protein
LKDEKYDEESYSECSSISSGFIRKFRDKKKERKIFLTDSDEEYYREDEFKHGLGTFE